MPDQIKIQDGLVVIFEGIDGVGKSTQIDLLKTHLETRGYVVVSLRNLGGSPIGEALREIMLSEIPRPPLTDMHISLAVQSALIEVIDRARSEGKVVLMDRGPYSLAAYQIYGTGIEGEIAWQHVDAGLNAIHPEVSILMQADIATSLERGRKHSGKADYFESKSLEYFQKVSQGYSEMATKYSLQTLDADRDIDEISRDVISIVDSYLARPAQHKHYPTLICVKITLLLCLLKLQIVIYN